MENNRFLIPANTKRGQLIFGWFKPIDLAIFLIGVGITFVALVILANIKHEAWMNVLAIIPGGIATILVIPFANYHNARVAIGEIFNFYYKNPREYRWRGWCFKYESRNK